MKNSVWNIGETVRIICVVFLVLFTHQGWAQSSLEHDLGFNVNDSGNGNGDWFNYPVRTILPLNNGKYLVGGNFDKINDNSAQHIARLNSDLTLDETFIAGTEVNGAVRCMAVSSSGKILLGGSFTEFNGAESPRLVRLNADGSIDLTFEVTHGTNGIVNSIIVLSSGEALLAGQFSKYKGNVVNRVVRVLDNGELDLTFSVGAGPNGPVHQVVELPDGSIMIVGEFSMVDNVSRNGFAKLQSDGSLDQSYEPDTDPGVFLRSLIVLSDGSIVVVGDSASSSGQTDGVLYKLDPTGTIDNSFQLQAGINGRINHINLFDDSRILITGQFSSWGGLEMPGVIRLMANGNPDPAFIGTTSPRQELFFGLPLPNNQSLLAGSFRNFGGLHIKHLAIVGENGIPLSSNLNGTGCDVESRGSLPLSNGSVIVYGDVHKYNGHPVGGIFKVDASGEFDETFDCGTGANERIYSVVGSNKEGIYVGGSFCCFNDLIRPGMVRLTDNGTIDNSFSIGTGFDGSVWALIVLENGNVVAAGDFAHYDGHPSGGMVVLDPTGAMVQSFNLGTGFNGPVIALHSPGANNILVGGHFTEYNGQDANNLVLLDETGTQDINWTSSGTNGPVYTLSSSPEGKLLVAGRFLTVNDTEQRFLASLNPNGSLNSDYQLGKWPDNVVRSILPLSNVDGFLIGGDFGEYDGIPSPYLSLVNWSGDRINNLNADAVPNKPVNGLAQSQNHSVIATGVFTQMGSIGRNRLARLNNIVTRSAETTSLTDLEIIPNPAQGQFVLEGLKSRLQIDIFDQAGRIVQSGLIAPAERFSIANLSSGVYQIRTCCEQISTSLKLVVTK